MVQRVVSFVLAFLIFASAVASGWFVIEAIRKEQKDQTTAQSAEEATKANETATEQPQPQAKETDLKGKPLANFTPSTDRLSEVKTEDITVGTGEEVLAGDTVTAHYTGARVTDGVVFESSKDSGNEFTAPLSNLIKGWQTGIPGMKVGGVRRLTIPAALAYGDDASTGRPTGDLVFDIELSATKR